MNMAFSLIFGVTAIIVIIPLIVAFRRGEFSFSGCRISMHDHPIAFWFWICVHMVAFMIALYTAVRAFVS